MVIYSHIYIADLQFAYIGVYVRRRTHHLTVLLSGTSAYVHHVLSSMVVLC